MEMYNCINCKCRMPSIHFEVTIKRGNRHDRRWYVKCPNCKTEGPTECRKNLAIESWNRLNHELSDKSIQLSKNKKSELIKLIQTVIDAGMNGVDHVGKANYSSRESEAREWITDASVRLLDFVNNKF